MIWNPFKRLGGQGAGLHPFETAAIEQVAALLGDEGSKLRRQMEAVNEVQRLILGKEVNLYRIVDGQPVQDDALAIGTRGGESLLATLHLKNPSSGGDVLKLEMWLAAGQLFSLIYDKPPGTVFSGQPLGAVQPVVADMKIWLDLSNAEDAVSGESDFNLSGWAKDWRDKGELMDLRPPLTTARRASALERIDAVLPADYLELIAQTDGARLRDWIIHGPDRIRKVVSPDSNYYLLAESPRCALVVKEGSKDGQLFGVDFEDDIERNLGSSFKSALENIERPS